MLKQEPITFEESRVKAAEYAASKKKLANLLAEARNKAKGNYQALLSVWESLHILLRMVRAQITGKFTAPVATILAAIAALIYFVEPLDLILDQVPVFGLLDDVAVITFVVRTNIRAISKFRKWECS